MLLIASVALAGTVNLGWPCSRMNWAWRNVWSTCSINSFVPTNAPGTDFAPAGFRRAPILAADGPTSWLDAATNHIIPSTAGAGIPSVVSMFCTALSTTNGGTAVGFQLLRNRCRRAIDAYGGIVQTCISPLGGNRGPVSGTILTDHSPLVAHVPHVNNVGALGLHARRCSESIAPQTHVSPSTTCPGLLGWWTVVWNVCGFRQHTPWAAPHGNTEAVTTPAFVDQVNGVLVAPRVFVNTVVQANLQAPNDAAAPNFVFCSPDTAAVAPQRWNQRGPVFRSSRCRKALDQFGRTAARCGGTSMGPSTTSAPAMGSASVLRNMMAGSTVGNFPQTLGSLAPVCN